VRGCELLRAAGFTLVCVTNQPDVATGLLAQSDLDAINGAIVGRLQLDALRYCPHVDTDGCACRKPKPGLLVDAARSLDLDLSGSYMVGDRWRDIDAGRSAGCRSVFIDRGYAERRACGMDFVCGDLADAAAWIIRDSSLGGRGLERSDL
jgi:D-glycero-D-manno-heptose 1,7-bisphosphate phosphatase